MDNMTSEVNTIIKGAIKAKLNELECYVDDELPDYIMYMVMNKKSKDKMDDDLSLFLGNNTETFTSWLHFVLAKLNAASAATKDSKGKVKLSDTDLSEKKDDEKKIEEKRKSTDKAKSDEDKKHSEPKTSKATSEERKASDIKKAIDAKKAIESKRLEDKKPSEQKKSELEKITESIKADLEASFPLTKAASPDLKEKKKKEKKKDKKHKSEKKQKKLEAKAEKKLRKLKKKEAKEKERQEREKEKERKLRAAERLIAIDAAELGKKETKMASPKNISITFKATPESTKSRIKEKIVEATNTKVKDTKYDEITSRILSEDSEEEEQEQDEDDVLHCNAEDDLSLSSEEEKVVKKRKKEKKKKSEQSSKRRMESNGESSSGTKRLKSESNKVSIKDRLNIPSAKPATSSIKSRLGLESSPQRNIINLREESSFPPRSEHKELVDGGIASTVSVVSEDSAASSSSNRKLEARIRPLMSSRVDEIDDDQGQTKRMGSAVGAVLKRRYSESDSEDGDHSPTSANGLASKVEVTARPRRPMQANRNLILRAMADAHKSTTKKRLQSPEEYSPPKKKKTELFTRNYEGREERQHFRSDLMEDAPISSRKIAVTLPYSVRDQGKIVSETDARNQILQNRRKKQALQAMETELDLDPSLDYMETADYIEDPMADAIMNPVQDETKFIVTLGPETKKFSENQISERLRSRLGAPVNRNPSMEFEEEYIEEVEEWEEEEEAASNISETTQPGGALALGIADPKLKVAKSTATVLPQPATAGKLNERCRYWPACKQGEACMYIHPKTPCKTFPACKFGDKCLYMHPTCMFDANCTKPNCHFMHTTPKVHPVVPAKVIPGVGAAPRPVAPMAFRPKCKFFPKCNNVNCPFAHPLPCKYGISCTLKNTCRFTHPELPSFSKLKWSAAKPNSDKNSATKWISPKLEEKAAAAAAALAAGKEAVLPGTDAVKNGVESEADGALPEVTKDVVAPVVEETVPVAAVAAEPSQA